MSEPRTIEANKVREALCNIKGEIDFALYPIRSFRELLNSGNPEKAGDVLEVLIRDCSQRIGKALQEEARKLKLEWPDAPLSEQIELK